MKFEESSLNIEATYWNDAIVDYEEIVSIEYREQDNAGERTFGYGSTKILIGQFENEEFGTYIRYSYTSCDACIVIKAEDNVLVLNGKDEESTKVIYQQLTEKIDVIK